MSVFVLCFAQIKDSRLDNTKMTSCILILLFAVCASAYQAVDVTLETEILGFRISKVADQTCIILESVFNFE